MKYLRSTSTKTWSVSINGVTQVIPAKDYLGIQDDEFKALKDRPVIASLLKNGDIIAVDEKPLSSDARLQVTNDQLLAKNKLLEQQVSALQKTQAKQAKDELAAKDKRIAELEALLKGTKK